MAMFFTFCIACNFFFFSQGSWIVKQSVGKKACLVGQALNINYFRGENYLEVNCTKNHVFCSNSSLSLSLNAITSMVHNLLESFCNDVLLLVVMWWNANITLCLKQLEIDVGSSTVARGVVSLVLGYLNNLVIEMAFLIQVKKPSFHNNIYVYTHTSIVIY